MKPHLMTSAMPEIISFFGQRVQGVEVHEDTGRRVERPDEVLAFGGVDAGLAADGGVHHAEQAGGHVDDLDAAQPGGGHEAGQVGDGAAADGDDASERVKSFWPSTCQQKEATSMCLPSSASGISAVSAVKPAAASSSLTVSPVRRSARGWMTRTRLTRSPSSPGRLASRPRPTTTS